MSKIYTLIGKAVKSEGGNLHVSGDGTAFCTDNERLKRQETDKHINNEWT